MDLLQDQLMNWRAEAEGEKERGIKEDSRGHVLSKNCAVRYKRGKPALREERILGSTIEGSALDMLR